MKSRNCKLEPHFSQYHRVTVQIQEVFATLGFMVEDVIVEIKAKSELEDIDHILTLAYLKASGYKVALLINFGGQKVDLKRFVSG